MSAHGRHAPAAAREVDDLPPLALSRPREAMTRARAVLAGHPDLYEASVAHQAAGIVLREFGDVAASVREFRRAVACARRGGYPDQEVDVLASLGVALVYAGRTAEGLATFDEAVQRSSGVLAARVRHRRGLTLWALGRYPAALDDLRLAVTVLDRAGDTLWTARALTARGLVHVSMGFPVRADADFLAAERLFADTSQVLEAIYTVQDRALVAFGSGDLPSALSLLDQATERFRPLGVPLPTLSTDRCAVLLAAGLFGQALAEAKLAVSDFEQVRGRVPKKAELLLMAANCALAAGHPQIALDWAQSAHQLFRRQQSAWWEAQARLVLARAKYAAGALSTGLLREAERTAARLEALGVSEAAQAHVLAGRVALDVGRRDAAIRHFTAAARYRRRGPAMAQAAGWLGAALLAQSRGDARALFAACRRGLQVMEEHWPTFGASELRAQATAHGAELAAMAQRQAAKQRKPRQLLSWSERWRATALAVPAVRPTADPEINADLASLRQVTRELEKPKRQGSQLAALRQEQLRLESAVRTRVLRSRREAGPARATVSVSELLDSLGPARMIQIVEVDDALHVLVSGAGVVRRYAAGRFQDAARAAEFARFALRRLARSHPADNPASSLAILSAYGPALQQALLGPAAAHLGSGPLVIVPPGRLHTVPWALLPALSDRVLSVAPSATSWVRAHAASPPDSRRVVLVRGPGLQSDGAEVEAAARLYDDVVLLSGAEATTGHVLAALDGAWLAHIAAHGNFRADSPLFSSLRLHDGPLTVYDFEQLRRAPHRLILSSCDSAVTAPAGADELLGLVSSLLPLGTAGVIAGVVPLSDSAVVPLMADLHRHLQAGLTLAAALQAVRRAPVTDQVQQATATALLALGSG